MAAASCPRTRLKHLHGTSNILSGESSSPQCGWDAPLVGFCGFGCLVPTFLTAIALQTPKPPEMSLFHAVKVSTSACVRVRPRALDWVMAPRWVKPLHTPRLSSGRPRGHYALISFEHRTYCRSAHPVFTIFLHPSDWPTPSTLYRPSWRFGPTCAAAGLARLAGCRNRKMATCQAGRPKL